MKKIFARPILLIVCLFLISIPITAFAFDWSEPVQISGTRGWNGDPEAAADNNGNVYVVWENRRFDYILFNSFDGDSWGTYKRIDHKELSYDPDIYVEPDGNVHVVWMNHPDGVYYRSFNGTAWTNPVGLGFSGWEPEVAVDATGTIFILGRSPGGGIDIVYYDGITWSQPARLSASEVCDPSLSVDTNGVAYLAYCRSDTKPAYRWWTGVGWSDEEAVEGACSARQLEMYHNTDGYADLICEGWGINFHWHQDASGWHGPFSPTADFNFGIFAQEADTYGESGGRLMIIFGDGESLNNHYLSVWTGEEWTSPEKVADVQYANGNPSIAISSEGIMTAIWDERVPGQYYALQASTAHLMFNNPPECETAYPSLESLWPVNHKFVAVEILGVTDPDGDAVVLTISSIFQDEPLDELGDGDTEADGQGVGESIAEVRAERSGVGNGRFYHLTFSVNDGHGGVCTGTVSVGVPFDSSPEGVPVDDGPLYDSTIPISE